MGREIRKGHDPLGNEIELVYEGGRKVGEIHTGLGFGGGTVKREYRGDGSLVSETTFRQGVTGETIERVRDAQGRPLGEVRPGVDVAGGRMGRVHDESGKIGEIHYDPGIGGKVKSVSRWFPRTRELAQRAEFGRNVSEETQDGFHFDTVPSGISATMGRAIGWPVARFGKLGLGILYLLWVSASCGGIFLARWMAEGSPSLGMMLLSGVVWLICLPGAIAGVVLLVALAVLWLLISAFF